MTLQLAERAVVNTIAYLQTHLGQYVAAVNAEWSDDLAITVPLPGNYYRARQPVYGSGQIPAVYVIAESSEGVQEDSGGFESTHALTIGVVTADHTPDRVRTALYRYLQACFLCMRAVTQTAGIFSHAVLWGTPYAQYHGLYDLSDAPSPNYFMDAHLSVIASLWEQV